MARRHEDRRPGARFRRGDERRGGPSHKGPARKGPARGPRSPRPANRRARGIVVTPLPTEAPGDGKVRLNRFLAMAGVCSRRAADELIASGRVEVGGEPATELGRRIDPRTDEVRVDGQPVRRERPVYVLVNKPKGVVCTNARHEQKTRLIDLMPEVRGRVFPVGRLDADSEGLILVTNDGDFALHMTHPRYGVPKVYAVLVRGRVGPDDLGKARGGVWLAEGPTTGMKVRIERAGNDRTYMKVTLREGKNREIRRVFARLGFPVLELKRVRIGDLSLHGLGSGRWRFLTPGEVEGLRAAARRDEGGEEA
jgi:23S rRNA pseudouridine2605 synthase